MALWWLLIPPAAWGVKKIYDWLSEDDSPPPRPSPPLPPARPLLPETPRLLILGVTGVGKSSLINAIFGEKLQEVNTPGSTTREFTTHEYEIAGTTIQITDSPGYGEIGHDEEYSARVIREAATHHAVTLVLKADEKGYERDRRIIEKAIRGSDFSEKPFLIALNQIDKIKPSREWSPPYEWDSPLAADDTAKTRNIKEKVSLVKEQFKPVVGKRALYVIPTMADEDEGAIFGVDRFKLCLFEILPEAAKVRFARTAKLAEKAYFKGQGVPSPGELRGEVDRELLRVDYRARQQQGRGGVKR